MTCGRFAGKQNLGSHLAACPRLLNLHEIRLTGVEADVDRVELDQRVERRTTHSDQRSNRSLIAAETPIKGRTDFRISKIELCGLYRGLRHGECCLTLRNGAVALVEGVLCQKAALRQRSAAIEIAAGIGQRRFVTLHLRFGLIERSLIFARIDSVEKIA